MYNKKLKKGFTLIELIVVMAVIGVLVLIATPKFIGYTKRANLTEIMANSKQIENASERYYMENQDWPRLSDNPYTITDINLFSKQIKDKTGQVVTLDPAGKYYDIDYEKLSKYVQKPKDGVHYIIQNPMGEVYYMDGLTQIGEQRIERSIKGEKFIQIIKTNSTNSFANTINYEDEKVVGTLTKTGEPTLTLSEDGLIPADTKSITYTVNQTNNTTFASIYNYNLDGYKGVLNKNGAYKVISNKTESMYATGSTYNPNCSRSFRCPPNYLYSQNGYYQIITLTNQNDSYYIRDGIEGMNVTCSYGGNVSKTVAVYGQDYVGSVTKPEQDNRTSVYSQVYEGIVNIK